MVRIEVPVSKLKDAIAARADYLLGNLATCTMKQCRRLLEEDLGVPAKTLDGCKDIVTKEVDKVVRAHKQRLVEEDAAAAAEEDAAAEEEEEEEAEGADSDEEEPHASPSPAKPKRRKESQGQQLIKRLKTESGRKAKKQKQNKEIKSELSATDKKFGKLKTICQKAGIKISPTFYKQNKETAERLDALRELLRKHGLDSNSTSSQIAAVKARLEQERDLDGIDSTNIVQGGRRSRTAAAKPINYKALYGEDSEDDAGALDEEEASGAEGGAASDGDADEAVSADENVAPAPAGILRTGRKDRITPVKGQTRFAAAAERTQRPALEPEEDSGAAKPDDESGGDGGADEDEPSSNSGSDWDMPAGEPKGNRRAIVESDDESLDLD